MMVRSRASLLLGLAVVAALLGCALLTPSAQGARCSQFAVSATGATTDPNRQAFDTDVAYNPDDSQALVVWSSDKDADTAFEIFGRIVDTTNGRFVTPEFKISQMGSDDKETTYDAMTPSVAYSTGEKEYFVVWQGDEQDRDNDFEIYGQRVSPEGQLLGARSVQITTTGPDSDARFLAANPIVVYNSQANTFYVVWEAPDDVTPAVVEIYGRSVQSQTTPFTLGAVNRLSYMGVDETDMAFNGFYPDVAYDSVTNQYLVVWQGENSTHHAFEAYGQTVDGATALPIGSNFQISDMGIDPTSTSFRAFRPKVEHNPTSNNFLVVWYGDTDRVGANGALNIYGQLLDANMNKIFRPSFPISQMADSPFDPSFDGVHPDVIYNAKDDEFLVIFEGDEPGQDDAYEVQIQRLTGQYGDSVGERIRVSTTGADDTDATYKVQKATGVYCSSEEKYYLAWGADFEGAPEAFEIFTEFVARNGELEIGNFCPDPSQGSSSRNTAAIAILIVVFFILGGAVIFAVYKFRANKKESVAERAAAVAAAARSAAAENRVNAKSKPKSRPPGSRKVKVSRKKKSRKPPAANPTKGLNEDPSYSYISYETYTYELDDDLSVDNSREDGAVLTGSDSGFSSDDIPARA